MRGSRCLKPINKAIVILDLLHCTAVQSAYDTGITMPSEADTCRQHVVPKLLAAA